MTKWKAFVSAIMVLILVFSCYAAYGESCYVALRELMNSKDQEAWYMGKGKSSSTEKGNDIFVVYVEKDNAFYIVGENEYGKGEITIWNNVEMARGYYMIYSLSGMWNTLQDNMDSGYSITLAITEMDQIEGDWIIDDEESASSFVQLMDSTLASMKSK